MESDVHEVSGFQFQEQPPLYIAAISGRWLLKRSTPVWRIDDPEKGFQRIVREDRARAIAFAVLDQQRTFPNAIVLATDRPGFAVKNGLVRVPSDIKFLVVDGQHRLWAQKFSLFEAVYPCIVHTSLSDVEMARLFLEINDNQRRVPSSLRWDLIQLVRPEDDQSSIAAAEMVYLLATDEESPFFQRIDLTGEQKEIQIKQGSLAPELRTLLSRRSPLFEYSFDQQYMFVTQFFYAVRELDRDGWGTKGSNFFEARVLRALIRLLRDIARFQPATKLTVQGFLPLLRKIDAASLAPERIRAVQASAGVKAIYDEIKKQVLN